MIINTQIARIKFDRIFNIAQKRQQELYVLVIKGKDLERQNILSRKLALLSRRFRYYDTFLEFMGKNY